MFAAFSPDSQSIACSGNRGEVRLLDRVDDRLRLRFERRHDGGEMASHPEYAPDGNSFLISGWDKTLRSWDVNTGYERWKVHTPSYARCFEAAVYSPDGTMIYCVTRDETLEAREAKTGDLRHAFRNRDGDEIRGLAISSKEPKLATVGHNGTIKIWQLGR